MKCFSSFTFVTPSHFGPDIVLYITIMYDVFMYLLLGSLCVN